MTRPLSTLLVTLSLSLPSALTAQVPACWVRGDALAAASRQSPLDSAVVEVAGGVAKLCYGSPAARGRTVMGALVPFDEPWRAGANEATAIHVTVPVEVAGVRLEPGSYSVYMIPGAERWTVVLNRQIERWGIPISQDVRAADVGQGTVTIETLDDPVEALTYRFETDGASGGHLVMEWERTRLRIPFKGA